MNQKRETGRVFKLALTIKDATDEPVQVAIVLGEDTEGVAMLGVVATGFAPDEEGAGMLADMLRDSANAIDEHLGKDREHTATDAIPVVKRPRFNPQPMGAKKGS